MSFGQDFLQGFFQPNGLKDYAHASKSYRTNGYEYSPRTKFLFHVVFNINTGQIPALQSIFGSGEIASISINVKTAQLPSYTVAVDTLNQYNRKRLVQSRLDYDPIQITFNDDQGDLIRNMWYNYFSYYYKDPSQKYNGNNVTNGTNGLLQTLLNGFGYNTRDTYSGSRNVNEWGYIGESYYDGLLNIGAGKEGGKPAFFRDITIYGMSQKKYASYTLINPIITAWNHDTYDYSQGDGVMTNTMTIKYETVKYGAGAIGGATPSNTVPGFADPAHYDTVKSALARPGATATVFGQGGLLEAIEGTYDDLSALASGNGGVMNVLGAVQKAGTAINTWQNRSITSAAALELQRAGQAYLYSLPGQTRLAMNNSNWGEIFPVPFGKNII